MGHGVDGFGYTDILTNALWTLHDYRIHRLESTSYDDLQEHGASPSTANQGWPMRDAFMRSGSSGRYAQRPVHLGCFVGASVDLRRSGRHRDPFSSWGPDEEPEFVNTEVVRRTKDGFAIEFCVPYSIVFASAWSSCTPRERLASSIESTFSGNVTHSDDG